MKRVYLLLLLGLSMTMQAQVSLVLQPGPDEGKDATVWSVDPDLTQPEYPDVIAAAWTWSGDAGVYRTFFEFDLTSIPTGTTIDFAYLSLYYNYVSTSNGQEGENASYLRRVIDPWDEATVNWITQPTATPENELYLEQSVDEEQDYLDIDVEALIQDMLDDPSGSFGFLLELDVEETYASMKFCSSDVDEAERRPKLVIGYDGVQDTIISDPEDTTVIETPEYDFTDCLVLQPENGKDARIWDVDPDNNEGDSQDFIAASWTWSGTPGSYRSMLGFDLSSIPDGSTVDSAFLFLYYNEVSTTNGQEGDNAAFLRRITEEWDENVVTWNTQPSTTSTNEITLATSANIDQDYLHIDVKDMVQDMIDFPLYGHGFMFRQVNENIYRSMKFYSSDADANLEEKPMLVVCYTPPPTEISNLENTLTTYPNPVNESFYVQLPFEYFDAKVEVFNCNGQEIQIRSEYLGSGLLSVKFPAGSIPGIYILNCTYVNGISYRKLLVKE